MWAGFANGFGVLYVFFVHSLMWWNSLKLNAYTNTLNIKSWVSKTLKIFVYNLRWAHQNAQPQLENQFCIAAKA